MVHTDLRDLRQAFEARCAAVASHVEERGITLAKGQAAHELCVTGRGETVVFPVVTDEHEWTELSAAAAFYGAMADAKAWTKLRLDPETTGSLDEFERLTLPIIAREASAESIRLRTLEQMLGGRHELDAVLEQVDAL
jgi:hypothetical protein